MPIETVTPDGLQVRVAAVTDDGMVITRTGSPCSSGHWSTARPSTSPAPLRAGTSSTTLLRKRWRERRRRAYLVDITAEGEITPRQQLPEQNERGPAASTEWLAWADPDQVGGEAAVVDAIWVQRIDGSDAGTLSPPQGWLFAAANGTWEDADHLIAAVVDDAGKERMVGGIPITRECVLIDAP